MGNTSNKETPKLPSQQRKSTERYDLSIPDNDEQNVRRALQDACDEEGIYPFRIAVGKTGIAVSFLRNPSVPQFRYSSIMMNLINSLKMDLGLTTIVMLKRQGCIDITNLPKEIIKIKKKRVSEHTEETDEGENGMFKKIEEDMDEFNSHAIRQIEEADYDTKEGRAADRRAMRLKRTAKKMPIKVEEEPRIAKNGRQMSIEGQYALDLTRL